MSRPEPDQRSTCKWCRAVIERREGGPWERAQLAGLGYDHQCHEAPNPDDGPMPGHEPGTAIVNRPGYDPEPGSVPVTFTFPGGHRVTVPPMPEDPRAAPEYEVIGYDEFAGEDYPLGDPIGTRAVFPSRELAAERARRHLEGLERTQPTASSGGQGFGGIQDRVYILHPGGRRERFLG
jgi:hypothetical protein